MEFDFSTAASRVADLGGLSAGRERGKALEELVAEMLTTIPGITMADRNVISGEREAEIDLLLTNAGPANGLEAFGRDILVECKSSEHPLDSTGVDHFVKQVERRGLRWSVIVSLAGLTGARGEAHAAHQSIREAMSRGHGISLFAYANAQIGHIGAIAPTGLLRLISSRRAIPGRRPAPAPRQASPLHPDASSPGVRA